MRHHCRAFLLCWPCLFWLACMAGGENTAADEELDLLRSRILAPFLDEPIDRKQVSSLMATQKPDGSWPGIDYRHQGRSAWRPVYHLINLQVLAFAWRSPASPFKNKAALEKATLGALDFWLARDFRNPNWWHNVIGVPRLLGPVLMLLEDELTAAQKKKGMEILKRGKLGMTGQNLVWVAQITAQRGILGRDPGLIKKAFDRIAAEIRLSRKEGIQPDFSFHQHGDCLYSHGYGAGFMVDTTRTARLVTGTSFAFSRDKIDLLASYLLEGSQWMVRGEAQDYGADGREITRRGQSGAYLKRAAETLLALPTGREKELRTFIRSFDQGAPPAVTGNRHFWCSDFMVHHRKHFYASSRMYSTRMCNTDAPCNSEGLLSHYLADGCNFLIISGREYPDIFEVWDWEKVPGTTVALRGTFTGSPRRRGTTDFAGGVSDGMYGASALDLERNGLTARKAWFFFDAEYVCLGAGISCTGKTSVSTIINQCFLAGDVFAEIDDHPMKPIPAGRHRLDRMSAVWHDGTAYLFPKPCRGILKHGPQTGSWHSVNKSYPAKQTTRNVFTLEIDHGASPKSLEYAYIVAPGLECNRIAAYRRSNVIKIICNSPQKQAVYHGGLKMGQLVFYEPGDCTLPMGLGSEGTTLSVSQPCLVLIQKNKDGLALSLADPTQKLKAMKTTLTGKWRGPGFAYNQETNTTTIPWDLPQGPLAGETTCLLLKWDKKR